MKNNNTIFKKIITVLILITVLMVLLFGVAVYNHFFNQNEKEIQNDLFPIKPPDGTIPPDPIAPPAVD
ncbi:MAG: hypothetical protein DDT42_00745 [candidate division WS2 bacterium]|uniref:Uncharacterized protein n=1 Tax=Psychracetigena formicireducens TaxID=2986056 RepID=A0A9E2BH10_PSYF1|nr:hypothetical protein [Candidatus Psychracetigena formicireducens]MBT9144889.1 hypothetical protein [Candidatus Psychracetigena formicireducens]